MMKHTPGPWELTEWDGETLGLIQGAENASVAEIKYPFGDARSEEACAGAYANARLIAAAPDLLAALRNIVEAVDSGEFRLTCDDGPANLDTARAAIRRATGEE